MKLMKGYRGHFMMLIHSFLSDRTLIICHVCLQMVATLRALEVAPISLADELVGYVKMSCTVLGDHLAKFARLEEDWAVINW